MYEVDILNNLQWVTIAEVENIKQVDSIVCKLMEDKPREYIRISHNKIFMCLLNGTEYQYWWFRGKYILGDDYDFLLNCHNYVGDEKYEHKKTK